MTPFPKTLFEFQEMFPTESACWNYLTRLRWPDGFVCPKCGMEARNFLDERKLFICKLGHQTTVTADTVMHKTHLSLRHWFWAAWLQVTQTHGVSSVVLSRQLGIKQESAYMMLQRLRAGMVDPDRTPLTGQVEVDETFVSSGRIRRTRPAGSYPRSRGGEKPVVIAAVEVRKDHSGRVRLRHIPDTGVVSIREFLKTHVAPGSLIITDGWTPYRAATAHGYKHHVVAGDTSVEKAENMPHVHRVFSNLKSWLIGTHHGVSVKHLPAYLNEYSFRFNRRGSPMHGFMRLLGIASHVQGPEYEELYGTPEHWQHPNPYEVRL